MTGGGHRPVVVTKLLIGVARTLGRLGVPVYGVHRAGDPASRSRYVRELLPWDVDREPPEATVEFLLRCARRIGERPVLIATDDTSCMAIADHADVLAEAYDFPRQPAGLARALYSKRGMLELCRRHGVPTPDAEFPASREDAERFAERAEYPVVVKAIESGLAERRGVDRTVIVGSAAELLAAYDRAEDPVEPNLMLQEYVPGGPDSVWMFDGYFDERSECSFGAIGRKLRQYPPTTGMTSLGVLEHNQEVEEITRRFMRELGYRGVLDCGYRYDARDGTYKLLDVNPRVGATFRLFRGARGTDVVRALYDDMTGRPVQPDAAPDGRKWLAEDFDLMTFLTLATDGGVDVRRWGRSLRGIDELKWYAPEDVRPFLSMTADVARKGARRARTTVRARRG